MTIKIKINKVAILGVRLAEKVCERFGFSRLNIEMRAFYLLRIRENVVSFCDQMI